MGWLSKIFGGKEEAEATTTLPDTTEVSFAPDGTVAEISVSEAEWAKRKKGSATYYSLKANSLFEATEVLKRVNRIAPMTYYIVETPDGNLGRDAMSFYTEAPLKTAALALPVSESSPQSVAWENLKCSFDDLMKGAQMVIEIRQRGSYANLIHLMQCGHCGYESPIETEPEGMTRQCYCCGATNTGGRGSVNIIAGMDFVSV